MTKLEYDSLQMALSALLDKNITMEVSKEAKDYLLEKGTNLISQEYKR